MFQTYFVDAAIALARRRRDGGAHLCASYSWGLVRSPHLAVLMQVPQLRQP